MRRAFVVFVVMMLLPFQMANAEQQSGAHVDHNRLVLSGDVTAQIDVAEFVSSYVDKTRNLDLADIQALPDSDFQHTCAIPSFGYTRDVIWHRVDITVENALEEQPLLEVEPSYLNVIDVFLVGNDLSRPLWRAHLGDHVAASERHFGGSAQVAALPALAPGDYRIYVRVQSNSANMFWLTLWPANDLISSLFLRNMAVSIFFWVVTGLSLTYLALGLFARDGIVVLYSVWVGAAGAVTVFANGLALSELRPEIPWLNDLLVGGFNIIAYGVTVFLWLYIIDAKKNYPVFYRICCAYGLLILTLTTGTTTDLYTIFGTYIIPSHSIFMATMCMILFKQALGDIRNPRHWSFLVVLVIPTCAAIVFQLALSGIIEANALRLTVHQFTLVLHLVGMGILMIIRLAKMDRERILVSRKAEQTTSLVEEQRKLISMLSHEFRTPLAVIQRSSEMLMLRLGNHKQDVVERLQRIPLQARKLARLVDIFLSKEGIDAQELSLAREDVLIEPYIENFVRQITRECAEVTVSCQDMSGVTVFIDETLMGLAVTNLVETSRRFAHGAPIHVRLYKPSERLIEINIPCQGDELDLNEINLIADALFRSNIDSPSPHRALGLHISQRIVEAHGGAITLRQNLEDGIELCLCLPCE